MSAEGGLDMREIRADIARTRRVLIVADAWGGRMTDALDRAAMINVSNDPCVDGGEVCVGLDVPGDLDTRDVLYAAAYTRDVLNTVDGWLASAQERLDIAEQIDITSPIDVMHVSQRDEGDGEGFQEPLAAAGGRTGDSIESNIQDGGGGGGGVVDVDGDDGGADVVGCGDDDGGDDG